jgi:hypothetical protein
MMKLIHDHTYKQMNGPAAAKLQQQTTRRLLVICVLASLVLIAFSANIAGEDVWLMSFVSIPTVIVAVLMNMSIRGIFELDDERLDEYQIGVRNDAYKTAYGFTLVFLLIVATALGGLQPERLQVFSVATAAFFTCALAPRMRVAWNMVDDHGLE